MISGVSSYKQLSGSHRQLSGSHRQLSGSHRQLYGSHRQLSSSHRQLSGSYKQLSVSHRQLSGSHRQLSGSHRHLSGSHRQLSSSHRQLSGSQSELLLCLFCRHTRLKHSNTTEKTCDICGKEFTKPSYVRKHKFTKHDVYDPSVKVGSERTTTGTSRDYLPPGLVSQQRSLAN